MNEEIIENSPSVVGSVAAWQNILNGCGYTPVLLISGQMDTATIATTKKFQKDVGLPQDGHVTQETWKAGLTHTKLPGWSNITPPVAVISSPGKIEITAAQIKKLAQAGAKTSYLNAFKNGQATLDRYGISNTPLRVAHFVAQIMHECGGLTIEFENLNFSAKRLPQVWPKRFKPIGPLNPTDYAHDPVKLANEVYGRRMGNGAPSSGDGFKYRGRGLLQLTGKDSYKEATEILQKTTPTAPDFVVNPDEVINAKWCLEIAASEWEAKGCNALADKDDINAITKKINGGLIGLTEREDWLKKTKHVWP
ncbi:MAG TPA: peptidoglycan-binding protein [Methylococcales bacterium]